MDILKKTKCKSFFLKCISLLVCAIMVLSVFTVSIIAQADTPDVWDGTKADSFAGGNGTAAEPFEIETPEQLYKMLMEYSTVTASKGVYFEIKNDIYLNDVANGTHVKDLTTKQNWLKEYGTSALPNGSTSNAFCGSLNGNGHTIYGLYTSGAGRSGLFHTLVNGASITNLSMDNIYLVDGGGYGGALVGRTMYVKNNPAIVIENCSVTNANIGGNMELAGGLVGHTSDGSINFTNCYSYNLTLSNWTSAGTPGGITGGAWSGGTVRMNNCYTVGYFVSNSTVNKTVCTNVYTNVAAPSGNTTAGVTVLTEDQMKGEAAKTNMAGFNFETVWETVDNEYPIINLRSNGKEVWDGTKAIKFARGKGTAEEPFEIETPQQLYKMLMEYSTVTASKGVYFEIKNDIYLNDVADGTHVKDLETKQNWLKEYGTSALPNGSTSNAFCGSLNGNGYTIYGLYTSGAGRSGLFHTLVNGASITNLSMDNVYLVDGGGYGGALVGRTMYVKNNPAIVIENCSVTNANIGGNMELAGGLVGHTSDGSINFTNCYSYNLTLSNWTSAGTPGGITGGAWSGGTVRMNNCYTVGYFVSNSKVNKTVCTNVYTNVAVPSGNTTAGVTVLTEDQMKGEAAKTNMSGLDFNNVWKTVENGYPVINFKGSASPVWNGSIATDYESGTGTKEDPYIIATAEQLAMVVTKGYTNTPGLYFKLANDIRLNDTSKENWKSTARNWVWADVRFVGTFDGDGHTIDGLYFNGSQKRPGLFSYVGDSVIKNLVITNASVTTTSSEEGSGILAAQASAKASFETIYIDATCELSAPNSKGVAGIVARSNQNVTIKDSAVLATISGKSHVGSFFGTHWGGTQSINNSFSASNVPMMPSRKLVNSANNYALTTNTSYDTGVTVLTADQMKGEAAKTNMPNLDYNYVWKTVEGGYPEFNLKAKPQRPDHVWDGTKANSFAGGTGVPDDPYLISNGAQLYKMVVEYSNSPTASGTINTTTYFKLTNDIHLNDVKAEDLVNPTASAWNEKGHLPWHTFTGTGKGFCGDFDGAGYTVYGLYATGGYAGLIPLLADGGNIHNVNLKNSYSTASTSGGSAGGLVGYVYSYWKLSPVSVSYCTVDSIVVESISPRAGGIIGGFYDLKATVSNCSVTRTKVTSTNTENPDLASAFVGYGGANTAKAAVDNCFTDSSVSPAAATTNKEQFDKIANKITYTNVYTTSTKNFDVEGITYLDSDTSIKGATAKESLAGFNFEKDWVVVENDYPILKNNAGLWVYDSSLPGEVWSGKIARTYALGNGSKENPYIIKTAGQLALLANDSLNKKTNGRYYKITEDIILNDTSNENWKETANEWFVGSWEQAFKGHLDGDYHTISGLYLNKTKETYDGPKYYGGLFAAISTKAVIEKLGIVNSSMVFTNYSEGSGTFVGAFAGFTSYEDFSYKVDNVKHYVTSEEFPVIRECFADTTVYLEAGTCGGFIGSAQAPIFVENSFFTGTVKGTGRGLFGYSKMDIYDDVLVKNFYTADSDYAIISNVSYDTFKYENTYSSAAQDTDGVTRLFIDRMVGNEAKTYMTGLDFENVWVLRGEKETPGLKGFKVDSYSNIMNPKDIKITFETYCDLNVEDITGKAYSKLTLPVLKRDGYEFEGWYAYPELDVPYNYDYFPTFDTILYAKWTLKGFEQGFELYEDSIYDYHEDYEYYLPTMPNYSTNYVHSGGKSMHRIGSSNEALDFLLMYKEELEIGKKYKIVFYTTTDQANAAVDISLVHLDWPDVYSANVGVEKVASVNNLVDGKWVEVSYTFVARSKWIAIRTSGNSSVYFDDFVLFEGGKGEIINLNNPQQTVKPNVDFGAQENGNTEEIVEDEDKLIESKPDNMQVNTKPKAEKNSMLVWYIVIAVAAVLILGGVAFVIIKRVKRK